MGATYWSTNPEITPPHSPDDGLNRRPRESRTAPRPQSRLVQQSPRWQPGFDRLGWMAEGLALQREADTVVEGTHLTCGAAYLAISKDEWDAMFVAYLDNHPGEPSETASSALNARIEKTSSSRSNLRTGVLQPLREGEPDEPEA